MTKIKELKQRFEAIEDMRNIVTAMKTLAFMESKKLSRYLADQGRAVGSIKAATADFLSFHPLLLTDAPLRRTVIIALGADRGFCGDFNERIALAMMTEVQAVGKENVVTIAVGDRLFERLQPDIAPLRSVAGATFAEEVPSVLAKVVQLVWSEIELHEAGLLQVKILAHQHGLDAISLIEPVTELLQNRADHASPPHLTLKAKELFPKLLDQYFRFVLYHAFYSSLMAENVKRTMHLDSALQKLDQNAIDLRRHYNQARQEEITEEIEILIMSMPGIAGKH